MPHNNKIHLPSWDSQKFVYGRYKDDMFVQGYKESEIASLRTFYRLWREEFSHVVIPEVSYHLTHSYSLKMLSSILS